MRHHSGEQEVTEPNTIAFTGSSTILIGFSFELIYFLQESYKTSLLVLVIKPLKLAYKTFMTHNIFSMF